MASVRYLPEGNGEQFVESTTQVRKDLVQPLMGKGKYMRLSCTLWCHVLKTSCDGDSNMTLGRLFPVIDFYHCKKITSYIEMKPILVQIVPIPLIFSVWGLVKRQPSSSL